MDKYVSKLMLVKKLTQQAKRGCEKDVAEVLNMAHFKHKRGKDHSREV